MVYLAAGVVFLFVGLMLASASRSYVRAKHNKPYAVRHGMFMADGKLIGTETDVMTDPVSGIQWLGRTRVTTR